MKLSDLQSKNIVNVLDGRNIGNIIDVNIGYDGNVESLVIEASRRFMSFNREEDKVVLWKDITKIGEDVILVKKSDNTK